MTPTTGSNSSGAPSAPVSASIHGPYEDAIIEGMKTMQVLLQSQPADVQQKLWNDFVAMINGLQMFASKIDVFHLFTAKQ